MIRNWLNRGGKSSLIQNMAAALGIGLGAAQPARWKYNTDPRAARHWHNPADPVQAARIEAAAAKRNMRERKLHNIHARGWDNPAHRTDYVFSAKGNLRSVTIPASLSPTYIAK